MGDRLVSSRPSAAHARPLSRESGSVRRVGWGCCSSGAGGDDRSHAKGEAGTRDRAAHSRRSRYQCSSGFSTSSRILGGWKCDASTLVTFHPGKAASTSLRLAPRIRGLLRLGHNEQQHGCVGRGHRADLPTHRLALGAVQAVEGPGVQHQLEVGADPRPPPWWPRREPTLRSRRRGRSGQALMSVVGTSAEARVISARSYTRADAVAASQSPPPWVPERQGGAHGVRHPVGCERVLIGTPERKGTP